MIVLFFLFWVSQLLRCSSLGSQRRISLQKIKQELFFIATTANYAWVSAWAVYVCPPATLFWFCLWQWRLRPELVLLLLMLSKEILPLMKLEEFRFELLQQIKPKGGQIFIFKADSLDKQGEHMHFPSLR